MERWGIIHVSLMMKRVGGNGNGMGWDGIMVERYRMYACMHVYMIQVACVQCSKKEKPEFRKSVRGFGEGVLQGKVKVCRSALVYDVLHM